MPENPINPKIKPKVGILISGRGSNMRVILERVNDGSLPIDVALVFSDNTSAEGLQIAKSFDVETATFAPASFGSFSEYEGTLVKLLHEKNIEWVICAGYMRILRKNMLTGFSGKIINIHPSLLPAFPGLNAQKQAIAAGVKVAGCTVHFVDEGVDSGKIIAQTAVEVSAADTVEDLTKRILKAEHDTYWKAIRQVILND